MDVSPSTAKSLRARPHPGARASRPHTTRHRKCPWTSAHPQQNACGARRPTRERGHTPARIRLGTRKCPRTSAHPQQNACQRDPPGSAGPPASAVRSRPHKAQGNDPWTSAHPQQNACQRDPTRERGRPARIPTRHKAIWTNLGSLRSKKLGRLANPGAGVHGGHSLQE